MVSVATIKPSHPDLSFPLMGVAHWLLQLFPCLILPSHPEQDFLLYSSWAAASYLAAVLALLVFLFSTSLEWDVLVTSPQTSHHLYGQTLSKGYQWAQVIKTKSMVQVTSQPIATAATGGQRRREEQAGADAAAYSQLGKEMPLCHEQGKENTAKSNYFRIVTSLCNARALWGY